MLTEEILIRLTAEALVTTFGCAPGYRCQAVPGAMMVLTGESIADQNYLLLSRDTPEARAAFNGYVEHCDAMELPFLCVVAPSLAASAAPVCRGFGLTHAVDWPLMVCPGEAAVDYPVDGVVIRRMSSAADHAAMAAAVGGAFQMPAEVVARATPLELYAAPAIEVTLAERDGRVLSSVTSTHHGSVVGIWSMATLAEVQGQGVGKALLSKVMADARAEGASAFFLGATPAGFPLYQHLGYQTVCEAPVWVRGETHQA
jgi:GNAT superfamily N-acetyltransferase